MRSKRRSESESSTNKKAVDAEHGHKGSVCRVRVLNAHCRSDSSAFPETQSAKVPHWFFKIRQQPGGEVGFITSADERKQRRGSGRADGGGEDVNLGKY